MVENFAPDVARQFGARCPLSFDVFALGSVFEGLRAQDMVT